MLTIAVPRGALFAETLDLLDRVGVDTAEVRGNDRKLLFEDVGLITMRPSDVPTYVEAGAADVGITGKDVLRDQGERGVGGGAARGRGGGGAAAGRAGGGGGGAGGAGRCRGVGGRGGPWDWGGSGGLW